MARIAILLVIGAVVGACAAPPAAVTMTDALPVDLATTASIDAPETAAEVDTASIAPAAATAAPLLAPRQPPPEYTPIPPTAQACCKVCRAGKACGDTCIARNKTCHVGQGCACDG